MKRVVAIILARGGSKGIPGKNIMDFCGKPLLAWSILQAKESKSISEVYVSSDDDQILDVAGHYGAVTIKRLPELATDTSTAEEALIHALNEIEKAKGSTPDIVVFLQATSPLREPKDIDAAIKKLLETKADSLLSVAILDDLCAFKQKENEIIGITYDPFSRGRRQDRELYYHDNGSIYLFRPSIIRKYNNRLGGKIITFKMPFWKSYEIDKAEDVDVCLYYFEKHLLPYWRRKEWINLVSDEAINLIVYDFDGVMTDNRVMVFQDGLEGVYVNRSDGLGVGMIRQLGIPQLILSTETNPVVRARAKKLKINLIGACTDKKATLTELCLKKKYNMKRVIYIGNDLNDFDVMKTVGIPMSPADGHPEIRSLAKIILNSNGGEGVVRELADLLLKHYKGGINGIKRNQDRRL